MNIFSVISLTGDDELTFALEIPTAKACYQYILRHCNPSHCVAYLENGDQDYKVWLYKHYEICPMMTGCAEKIATQI